MTKDQKTLSNLLHLDGYKVIHRNFIPASMGESTRRVILLEDIKDCSTIKLFEEKGFNCGFYFIFIRKSNNLAKFYLSPHKNRSKQIFTIHYFRLRDGPNYSPKELSDFVNYLTEKSFNE